MERGNILIKTTMGDLIDIFIEQWVVISYQEGLDKPEIIGPFNSQAEAQIWSSEHFSIKDEIKHQITWLVKPT